MHIHTCTCVYKKHMHTNPWEFVPEVQDKLHIQSSPSP